MSLIVGTFVAFCSIGSSITVITDWMREDETPINVVPLNFSANLLNRDAKGVLPYTRLGSDEALDFWPEVEEGEIEELIFNDRYEAEERVYHHPSLDADDWKFIKNDPRGEAIFEEMVEREMKNPTPADKLLKLTLVGVAQPD